MNLRLRFIANDMIISGTRTWSKVGKADKKLEFYYSVLGRLA